MLRALFAASLVALLAGCASIPEAKQPPAHKSQSAKARPAAVKAAPAQPAPEAKPPTFKERWFDRFMKHKPK